MPAAHLNYISQLGWSSSAEDEIMSLGEIVDAFDLKEIQKGGARFDYEKAKWVNQQHIQRLDVEQAKSLILDRCPELKEQYEDEAVLKIVALIQERIELLNDIPALCSVFLEQPKTYDEKGMQKIYKLDLDTLINSIIQLIDENSLDEFKDAVFRFCKDQSIGMGAVMQTLRMAAVGNLSGPDIVEVIKVIGKNSILERLELLKNQR